MISPTAKTLTYTESKQELINRGSSNTGTIEYKLDNGEYLTSIPKATNPGTYNVYLTPNRGYQWNDGTRKDTKLVSCTISKKNIANIEIYYKPLMLFDVPYKIKFYLFMHKYFMKNK